ncbi:DedA family protein [Candidatus Gracilibacteria bacterium]|nr:DedA family protein [Candidatus Gracilibacteria bacterium]
MNTKNMKRLLSYIITALHAVLLMAMVGIGLLSLFRPDIMRGVIDWMGIQIKSWGDWNYLILFLVAMAESFPFVGAVVPGMNLMILVGGFFVARQWDIFPLAALLAMVGACLGNALGYFMGRYGNPDTLKKYGAFFGAGPKELAWLEKQMNKNGFWFIVGGKFHNLLRSFIPYIAGSHKMSGTRFWVANIFGSSLWAVSILLIGVFAVENYEVILQYLNYIIIALVIGGVIIYQFKQKK